MSYTLKDPMSAEQYASSPGMSYTMKDPMSAEEYA
jgi:hypothetical protein